MTLKPPKAKGDQLAVLDLLADAGAVSIATAVRAPEMAGGNLINRIFARGWIDKADAGRWWLTPAGEAARREAVAWRSQAADA